MECLSRWATLYLLLYLSIKTENILCKNIPLERIPSEVSTQPQTGNSIREVTQTQSPSKAQLINALFSYAAAKGLLPKTTQIIQSATLPQEQLQAASQITLNTLNTVSFQPPVSSSCEKKPFIPSTPAVSTNPTPNPILPPITSFSPHITLQPTVKTEPVSWTFSPTAYQGAYSENYLQPSQTVWQTSQQAQPFSPMNELIPPYPYLQFTLPNYARTPINTECCTVENVCETDYGTFPDESLVVTTDGKPGIPINLQINIPSPSDLCPSITIVAAPANPEPAISTFSPYAFPPPAPIIMRRSRSDLRNLLPILLLSIINDCGCCEYGCNCDNDDPIPIPYPIPIPVNNPIVNSGCYSQYSSRNR